MYQALTDRIPEITARQREVVALIAAGCSNEEVGERLGISPRTAKAHSDALRQKLGVSRRVVAYYEQADAQPPGPLLLDLAQALQVSTDELLGRRPLKTPPSSPKTVRLLKRLQQVETLPRTDQQAVLKFVDALVTSRGRAGRNGGRRRAPA